MSGSDGSHRAERDFRAQVVALLHVAVLVLERGRPSGVTSRARAVCAAQRDPARAALARVEPERRRPRPNVAYVPASATQSGPTLAATVPALTPAARRERPRSSATEWPD
jgi:hypothetical protein